MNWKGLIKEISPVWNFKVILVIFLWAGGVGRAEHRDRSLCPANFHGNCKCDLDRETNYYIVNCTDTNLDNANILEYMPVDTEVLIFTGNNVLDLPLYIFGRDAKYDKLKIVDLSNNKIQTIKDRTFHGVDNVEKLILNDNDLYLNGKDNQPKMFRHFLNLEELHLRNTFTKKFIWSDHYMENLEKIFMQSRLTNLRILNLEKNEINSIPNRNFFCDLPSLRELRLSDNHLTEFNINIKCLPHLNILDLSHNYISYLNNETLTELELYPQLKINLSENPFRCDCNMIDFFQWISTTEANLISKDLYYCKDGFPPQNIGRPLSNLTTNDLLCRFFAHDFYTDLKAIYIILTLIIIAMVALVITIIVYKNKRFVYDVAHRMSINIRRKFQYDSLDKVEETEMEV
ncbi:trophoblast glycoprotein [Centruroides vittatus]|uniref:trophoblast glycoprotein n=1 Tax=Centruroides vittatus TaxID=120091 RepID=UPI003510BEE0